MTPIEAARAIEDELYAVSGKPVLDREDGSITGPRTESKELVADFVRELIFLGRQAVALREICQRLDLVVDRISPPHRLFDGMMVGPPVRVPIDVSMSLRKNDNSERHCLRARSLSRVSLRASARGIP